MVVSVVDAVDIVQYKFTKGKGAAGFSDDNGIPLLGQVKRDGMVCTVSTKAGRV